MFMFHVCSFLKHAVIVTQFLVPPQVHCATDWNSGLAHRTLLLHYCMCAFVNVTYLPFWFSRFIPTAALSLPYQDIWVSFIAEVAFSPRTYYCVLYGALYTIHRYEISAAVGPLSYRLSAFTTTEDPAETEMSTICP